MILIVLHKDLNDANDNKKIIADVNIFGEIGNDN